MMVNDGVDIETDLIGVLDLVKDFPSHIAVRFSRRGLHLRVNAESHSPSGSTAALDEVSRWSRTVRALKPRCRNPTPETLRS